MSAPVRTTGRAGPHLSAISLSVRALDPAARAKLRLPNTKQEPTYRQQDASASRDIEEHNTQAQGFVFSLTRHPTCAF